MGLLGVHWLAGVQADVQARGGRLPRARGAGVSRGPQVYTAQDEHVLHELVAQGLLLREIAQQVGKPRRAIAQKLRRMGLSARRLPCHERRAWTPDEMAVLRAFYPIATASSLVHVFGRPAEQIYGAAERLGLRKAGVAAAIAMQECLTPVAKCGNWTES